MATYERAIAMEVAPDPVFQFISDPKNWNQFVPTVESAELLPGGHVRTQGVARGKAYDQHGNYTLHGQQRRIEWGSEQDHHYSGWLEVRQGDTSPEVCEVTMELEFKTPGADSLGEAVLELMEQCLESIKKHFVGKR